MLRYRSSILREAIRGEVQPPTRPDDPRLLRLRRQAQRRREFPVPTDRAGYVRRLAPGVRRARCEVGDTQRVDR